MNELSIALKNIVGKEIEKVDQSDGYVNLKFVGGGDLTIYNLVTMVQPKKADINIVAASRIKGIIEEPQFVQIYFDNGSILNVSLVFDSSRGVESMQLVLPGRPIVVWN